MRKFMSFSGGVESSTMALLFGAIATPIFADTGYEHDKMYERLETVDSKLKQIHGDQFEIKKVHADIEKDGQKITTLPQYIEAYKYYPSFTTRYCTRIFKIEPIDKFLESFEGEKELMIGLNYDESDERTGNHGLVSSVTYSYPLVELGLTRNACIELLKRFDLAPNMPAYMQRGGCIGCYFKSKKEYMAMALLAPHEYAIVEYLEAKIQDKRGTFYHIHPDIPNLKEFKKQAEAQLFPASEMYPEKEFKTNCGVFCHR